MLRFSGRWLRYTIASLFFSVLSFVSTDAFSLPAHELIRAQWSLISLPADPGRDGTVEALFGDDLPADRYGSTDGWYLFGFDAVSGQYQSVALDDRLSANDGYWIVQFVDDVVEIDLPDNLPPVAGESMPGCPDGQLCALRPLARSGSQISWSLVGYSSDFATRFGDTRFVTAGSTCSSACSPDDALDAGVANNVLFRYNPRNADSPYERVTADTVLNPWDGYWLAALPGDESLAWILPVAVDPRTGAAGPPGIAIRSAENDAVRLLMQGSFGPTASAVAEVLAAGGPEGWIDEQLGLRASLHLPRVLANYPDESDFQRARYTTFWHRAVNAKDQLRQRVAFALSSILVISDRSDNIDNDSNMGAAYYDVLVSGAFGNYRDLLEAVTLNPAMGVYLSMLGNDKPDPETGRRADENYAREMMQLFSIGLVGLNIDGTEQPGVITFEQSDVESLARVLTGWSWDVGEWRTNARRDWKPDRRVLEKPMASFPEHHDTDVKRFLGIEIPAGQSPEQDLKIALDRVFNHPNVGPFIGKQLIKRLVTSNPSAAYVARVASAFNDNGTGVRGDLSAVVRAILLDPEARGYEISRRPDFGKLRESILRYSHVLRAFRAQSAYQIEPYQRNRVPQVAPLTAPSVFSFFSPEYSPPGAISAGNLVAPEFQLNSETNVNAVNRTLARMILDGQFLGSPVTLNLRRETNLLSNAPALVSHLDLLLTAETLTDRSRQILVEYINSNRGNMDDQRLLQDVIVLVISSTEFAIQR